MESAMEAARRKERIARLRVCMLESKKESPAPSSRLADLVSSLTDACGALSDIRIPNLSNMLDESAALVVAPRASQHTDDNQSHFSEVKEYEPDRYLIGFVV